jgi:hypothetical protein
MKTITFDETKWKLVPLVETDQQMEEARKHIEWACIPEVRNIYRAMVAVAAEPPREHWTGPSD